MAWLVVWLVVWLWLERGVGKGLSKRISKISRRGLGRVSVEFEADKMKKKRYRSSISSDNRDDIRKRTSSASVACSIRDLVGRLSGT